MKQTQIERAIEVIRQEIKEREAVITRLQQFQASARPKKTKASKPSDVARPA